MVECLFTMQVIVCSSPLMSVSLLILPLSWARSSLTVKQSQNVDLSRCVCDMIKTHNNTMVCTKPFSHQLQCIPINSHSLPPTPIYSYLLLLILKSLLPFLALFHPLSIMFSSFHLILNPPQTMWRLSLTHFQSISKCSHPIQPIIYHLNPYLVPVFTCLLALRTCVLMRLCVSRAHVPMQSISMHFTADFYILYMPLCVLMRQD